MSRPDIYYWKCDRPAAFRGTEARMTSAQCGDEETDNRLSPELLRHFGAGRVDVSTAYSQGIYRTWRVKVDGREMFVRTDDSADSGDRIEMESIVLDRVRALGVPVPEVFAFDSSRLHVPFAWQALELVPFPELNHWFRRKELESDTVAFEIGKNVAKWQSLQPHGFGPFDLEAWREGRGLAGFHQTYGDFFRVRLSDHLDYLVKGGFFPEKKREEIARAIEDHDALLEIEQGCLVHKDLALWNILGPANHVAAFIDFDDAISGDSMDDLSLLGCFHDAAFLERAFAGYESERALPADWRRRFWLHLLRNLIVKAVIRLGAGYFQRDSGFFLITPDGSGADLRTFTGERIATALRGLREDSDLSIL
jgi:fructosamine-3-kinase